jgi:hypothetical protein
MWQKDLLTDCFMLVAATNAHLFEDVIIINHCNFAAVCLISLSGQCFNQFNLYQMKKILLLISALILVGCSATNPMIMAGTYKAPKWSMPELVVARLNNISVAANENLELKTDSTFAYYNCSISATGHWKLNKDTLLVYYEKWRFIIEELNDDPAYQSAIKYDSIPYRYLVSKDRRVLKHFGKKKNGGTMLVELRRI